MNKGMETRLRFVEALSELMETCPLERVKVSHLCERMGVSRATFYEHFRDIFDVPTWFWDYLMSQSLYRMGIDQTCFDAHLKKFNLLLDNKEFFVHAYRCADYNSVCEHGGRVVKEYMVDNALANAERPFTEQELLEIDFYNTGAQYMTREWVRNGMVQTPRQMAELYQKFTPAFLIEFLNPAS